MKLALGDVAVRFGRVEALRGISLDLEPGKVHVLAGPNGAGKSTLLGVLLGLVTPTCGQLRVGDRRWDLSRQRTPFSVRERLGYLPEAVAFSEALSGRQVLSFFGRARGTKARVDAVLERVGLAQAARRAVRGYSRGMRQRLGLAVAILSEPELLVLDEPTGGLDQQGLSLLWELLSEWRKAGRSVVISTHDLALIERRADEISVLREGRRIARGSPAELRAQVQLPVVLHFEVDEARHSAAIAARVREQLVEARVQAADRVVHIHTRADDIVGVVGLLNGQLQHIRATRIDQPGLDEVYEHLLRTGEAP